MGRPAQQPAGSLGHHLDLSLAQQGQARLVGPGPLWFFSSFFPLAFAKFASRIGLAKQLCYLVIYELIPEPISDLPLHLDASYQLPSSWDRLQMGLSVQS